MTLIRQIIRNGASRLVGVVNEKAQIQYQEASLKLETHARVFKQSLQNTAPYLVATGLGKVRNSFKRTELLPSVKKQQTHHNTATGRIEKLKRDASHRERNFRWYDMAMKMKTEEMRRERDTRLQETQQKELAERKRRQQQQQRQQRHAPRAQYSLEHLAGIKDTRHQWTPPPAPPPVGFGKLQHPAEFYANQTPEERRAYIHEKLTNVLGEEKMNEPMLPSGHNPIEPVIAEHNQRMATISLLNQYDAHRAEVQRQHEEQIRLAREEEATRLKTQILLGHYKDIYQGRVDMLAMYTGDMLIGIDRLERVIQDGSPGWEVSKVVQILTHQVFEPVYRLLQEFDDEIPLDPEGAQKLKEAWPMARLDELYKFLESRVDGLSSDVLYMFEGIRLIAQRLHNPTPFFDPLAPKPCPFSDSCLDQGSTNTYPMAAVAPQVVPTLPTAVPPPTDGWSFRGRASASGIDPDAPEAYTPTATTSAPTNSGISKLVAGTAEDIAAKAAGTQIPSITVEPDDSVARAYVLNYIGTDHMVLQAEIEDTFRNEEPKSIHRRAVSECIKGLMDAANGEEKILGTMDALHYRSQIEKCAAKIDALSRRYREVKDTKALQKLCRQALRIWAVQV